MKVAPVTRAVRAALTASAAMFALAGSGVAFAGECTAPMDNTVHCSGFFSLPLEYDVEDLTLILDDTVHANFGVKVAGSGDISVENAGMVTSFGGTGLEAYGAESLAVANAGSIRGMGGNFGFGTGILATSLGDITVDNSGSVLATGYTGAIGIMAASQGDGSQVVVNNDGYVGAEGTGASAVGIYAYAPDGSVEITNEAAINTEAWEGMADGIFAYAETVDVANSGDMHVFAGTIAGGVWAAGIEAQASDQVHVSNDGTIRVFSKDNAPSGHAYGIYATGANAASVENAGYVYAQGYYSTGVYARSQGDVSVGNSGDIIAGAAFSSGYQASAVSTGISALAAGDGASIDIDNSGGMIANGVYGATGISAIAVGAGATSSVENEGTIYANQYGKYGYGAAGIVASGDGLASIDNGGSIEVISGGLAYGAEALSFNGASSATNSGDITVSSSSLYYYGATGIVSFAQNGSASAANSGSIDVSTKYIGNGIDAAGMTGVDVANSGEISVDAWYGYGIRAIAGAGDVSVANSGTIAGIYTGTYAAGKAWGILALTTTGDITVDNSGGISTDAIDQSVGIFARPAEGDATVDNSGSIHAGSYVGTAAGVFARADQGDIAIANGAGGSIEASSTYGYAYGVLGSGNGVDVVNDGAITATGFYAAAGINVYGAETVDISGSGSIQAIAYGNARGVNAASGDGDVAIANGGDVLAGSLLLDAIGLYAYSTNGDVEVSNDGYVAAISLSGLADGIFAYGANTNVTNGAGGTVVALGYSWAAGIEAQAADAVSVSNAGTIAVQTYGVSEGFGIYASGGDGGAIVDNSGLVQVHGYDQATGIYARASGSVDIGNSGAIYAGYLAVDDHGNTYSSSDASAIMAVSGTEGASVDIDSSGFLYAVSFSASSGAEARSLGAGGSASVTNSGDVLVAALAGGGSATGIVATADGDASADNSGSIYAYSGGMSYGAVALAFNGDASVSNSGDIDAVNTAGRYYSSYGTVSASQNGAASADNSGDIHVYSPYIGVGMESSGLTGSDASNSGDIAADAWVSYGMRTTSGQGDVSVGNSGSIAAYYSGTYFGYSFGMLASTVAGDIAVDNSGDISSDGGLQGVAVFATTSAGDVSVENSGDLHATTYVGTSVGLFARASAGTATIESSGDIDSTATYGNSYGVLARGMYLDASNSGNIAASGYYGAYGAYLAGVAYSSLDNSGTISAYSSSGLAAGVVATGYYGAHIGNSGDISASAGASGAAVGVFAQAYGDVLVENSGTISASQQDQAIAVALYSAAGTATLVNSGTLATDTSAAGSIAVFGSPGANEIHNTGDIQGAIVTFGADDLFANGQGGTWHVANGTTYFGGGDDAIVNAGTIALSGGGIFMGSSGAAGNSFVNTGNIHTSGYGLVDMGTGPTSLVPSLNPLPLVNNGVIDFVDGSPDDMLVILGDLGGDGAINVDLSQLNGTADLLYVDGSVVDGTSQAINLYIDGVPATVQGAPAPVVAVTGTIANGAFTGGQVLDFDASNFLDLDVSVGTSQAGNVNVVSASVDVVGLNDTGVLAASVAQGAQSLVNSAIGTLRQRMGVQYPLEDGQAGLSPWLRFYTDKGDVSPDGSGFGSNADFGFEQENRGREFGMNFALGRGFNIGILGGTADGTQRLSASGGSDRLKLRGTGVYATWYASRFYVDVSQRWMDFDARLDAASGERLTSGNASATNVEAGFTGWTSNGIDIVPQVQYTRSKIDNVDPVLGSQTQMDIDGGNSERGRVGVAVSRTFAAAGGYSWTPYGALSAVREFDGKTGFTVADAFTGSTSAGGDSTLAEFGIGLHKGAFSATAGVNWADGGAVDNARGGQLVVRYTW